MTGTRAQLAGLAAARAALEMGRATPTIPTRLVFRPTRDATASLSVAIHTDLAAAHCHLMATIDASNIARDVAGVPDGVWYCQPDRYQ